MESNELLESIAESAKTNFKSGLNCAESVLKAVMDNFDHGFPPEIVALATGFGGGMGLSGNNCGALTGGIMAVGLIHGRKNPLEGEFKERVEKLYGNPGRYRFFNGIPHRFVDEFGQIDCSKINEGCEIWFDKDRFRKCMKIVIGTAKIAADFIVEGNETGYTQKFGSNMAGKI